MKTFKVFACVCPCVYVYVCLFYVLYYSPLESRTRALSSECNIDLSDFTDLMSFLRSNLMEKTKPNPEALSTNT